MTSSLLLLLLKTSMEFQTLNVSCTKKPYLLAVTALLHQKFIYCYSQWDLVTDCRMLMYRFWRRRVSCAALLWSRLWTALMQWSSTVLTRSLLLHSDMLAAGVLLASSAESVENPSISAKVIGKSIEVPFFDSQCRVFIVHHTCV